MILGTLLKDKESSCCHFSNDNFIYMERLRVLEEEIFAEAQAGFSQNMQPGYDVPWKRVSLIRMRSETAAIMAKVDDYEESLASRLSLLILTFIISIYLVFAYTDATDTFLRIFSLFLASLPIVVVTICMNSELKRHGCRNLGRGWRLTITTRGILRTIKTSEA